MTWEKIEARLQKALTVKISLPSGTIWLPDSHLTIDDWLTSVAQTDEELQELNIPRIRFLQNRWPIVQLVELEWNDEFFKRAIVAMNVGRRAYILFSDWNEYQVIAAVEPNNKPSLYRAVVGKLLANRSFIPTWPAHIKNRRPDLVPELIVSPDRDPDASPALGRPLDWMNSGSKLNQRWKDFLSDIFVGWIGKWLNLPEMGFWHEDMPESIGRADKGEIVMKYNGAFTR
jgi:hypothetical protein